MDAAPDDTVAVMSLRAAANQLGYLVGAATGGVALATGGFPALGAALATLFGLGALLHVAPVSRRRAASAASRA
jgi:predicted MFS family arabinose efflux permease